jgi:putative oxidoreductase
MAIVMVVAAITVHWPFGFSSIKLLSVTANGPTFGPPGYEVALLYLAGLASLALTGAGPISIEALLRRRRDR